jgi:NAD(P)-dependent dehydrogenase (short-subunit alcohol dehydrogenase family)
VGLGLAVTEHALKKGDSVLATCRKPEVLSHLTKQYDSSKLVVVKLDVTKPDEIKAAFAEAERAFKRIDVVYSNAGYGGVGEIEGFPPEHARGFFEVNFWGAANVSTEAVRFFREVNGPTIGGKLLQVSSMVGYQGAPGLGYYSASKQGAELSLFSLPCIHELFVAIEGLIESLAGEVVPAWNIKVSTPFSHLSISTQPTHRSTSSPPEVSRLVAPSPNRW